MPSLRPIILVLPALIAGCGLFKKDVVACTDEARPAIAVTTRDSVTNSFPGTGSSVVAIDGAYKDSTTNSFNGVYGLAYERAGTYTVTVQHTGYLKWTRAGVVVTKDACHVQTVELSALLQK